MPWYSWKTAELELNNNHSLTFYLNKVHGCTISDITLTCFRSQFFITLTVLSIILCLIDRCLIFHRLCKCSNCVCNLKKNNNKIIFIIFFNTYINLFFYFYKVDIIQKLRGQNCSMPSFSLKIFMCSETCLNKTSLWPAFVSRIDRWSDILHWDLIFKSLVYASFSGLFSVWIRQVSLYFHGKTKLQGDIHILRSVCIRQDTEYEAYGVNSLKQQLAVVIFIQG